MEFKKIGVVGTGLMGGGIAQVCAQAGYETVSYDVNEAAFDRTKGLIQASMDKMVAKGKFTQEFVNEVLGRMSYTTNIKDLAECDIVVEAVFENLDVKLGVLKQVEEVVSEKCLIFTNTSALSITTLGTALKHRDRFMGTHFFAPVPAMKLLELVPGLDTSDETYEGAVQWAQSIKKITIKAPDTCGFISNRLLPLPTNESEELIVQGVKPEDVDFCYKMYSQAPIGTLEMSDTGGSHVTLGCLVSIYEGMDDDRYRPHPLIKQLVAAGRLGVKTGQGFFKWD